LKEQKKREKKMIEKMTKKCENEESIDGILEDKNGNDQISSCNQKFGLKKFKNNWFLQKPPLLNLEKVTNP